MAISVERGVFSGVLGLGGTGAIMMWPDQWWLGAALLVAAVALLLWGIKWNGRHWWQVLPKPRNPFHRRGSLYTGIIYVSDSELDTKHFLDVSVRAFNGSPYSFQTLTIEGTVSIDFSPVGGGSSRGGFVLSAPILYFETAKPHEPDTEFVLGTRLFMSADQVAEFRKQEAEGYSAQLMFQALKVEVETKRGKRMRLPLWDGISLRGSRISRIQAATITAGTSTETAFGT